MFQFENPLHLYALIAIPVLVMIYYVAQYARQKAIARFGTSTLMAQLMPAMSRYKHTVKFILLIVALIFLIVGWANPQWGTKKEKVKRKSADIFIALDISQSMMAEDIRPNRLERAKLFTLKLIEGLKGERLGIIIFAGNAYLQMPLTTDYAAAMLFVKSANTNLAPTQGTAIADAISLAERSFPEDNKNHKALIIISDGENHDQEALDQAETAQENGLLIFTVGVGTINGSFIPVFVNGRSDYKRDKTGNAVRSQLNIEMLSDLAKAGNGNYFNLIDDTPAVVNALKTSIDKVEKRELEQRVFNEYESYFQYFLLFALLLLLSEFFISYRKNKWLKGKDMFS